MNATQTPATPPAAQPRGWVWRCTDDSIAAGQISLLAVAETLAAVSVYWWLAFHFDWHWFSLVSLIAAPVLLLRSEESVELGVEMLQLWAKRKKSDVGRWEKVMVDLLVGLVAGGAAYFLAQAWSPGHEGWASFWRAGVIGAFAFALAIAVEIAIAGAITITIALARGAVLRLIFGPSAATGALLRALFIRWFASLHFFFYGLKRLPCNWRENLLVIDLIHPPELLPQAGRVRNAFTVAGLWRAIACKTGFDKAYGIILIIAWYLPALAYRWSLKASAWLWWPLALALTPPFEGLDAYARRERAAVVSRGMWAKLLWLILLLLVPWLLLSLPPVVKDWLHLLSPAMAEQAQVLKDKLPPPPLGLCYGLLWLVAMLASRFVWCSSNLVASYDKVLGSPRGYSELSDAEKEDFESRARPVERLRLWMIVALILLGQAFAVDFVHARNPAEIERLVWPWLLGIL